MSNIIDQALRDRALDCEQSFIVQAPAGSGKTELLTQRFLRLLATVENPEEVVAITFTRKAASEMRARIYGALLSAQKSMPELEHSAKTWQLANEVIGKNNLLGWNLLENPNRLRIVTIDSLCAKLAKSAPIISNFGTIATILEDPEQLYLEAASMLLQSLNESVPWQSHLCNLLLHLDNNFSIVQELFVGMLKRRDQWLNHVVKHRAEKDSRDYLESALKNIIVETLHQVRKAFPKLLANEIISLGQFAANNLNNSKSPIRHLQFLTDLPDVKISDLPAWLGIVELLLTKSNEWRKTVNKTCGFPSASDCKDVKQAFLYKQMKERMLKLLEELPTETQFKNALQRVALLPPATYSNDQWEIIEGLLELLPILVAYLHTLFRNHNAVDFIAIAQGALQALGEHDNPTDLALNLDYRIKHLLVDEFQDTSKTQFKLIELLISGWDQSDGRTLFLVGDPMQSIYRFREAQVGLFLRVKNKGIGHIKLEPITLKVNFRSEAGIIKWLNESFAKIFPEQENSELGAIPFAPSVAFSSTESDEQVVIHPLCNATGEQEAKHIIDLIKQEQSLRPGNSIAILVRSRNHLLQIVPALKKAKVEFQALEIDKLIYSEPVADLLALTKALCHLGCRINWLSILRAPWCGLTLSDLYLIANYRPKVTIWQNLQQYEHITDLSVDGKRRIERILPILAPAIQSRYRVNFREWLETTWLALGGPACLHESHELNNTNAYFNLLEQLQLKGEIDINLLEEKLQNTYCNNPTKSGAVQLLTIHKAKGLEYDIVIIPSLEKKPAIDESQLLLWLERTNSQGGEDLIFAPIKSLDQDYDPIYRFIRTQEASKSKYEITRLLYVAATRARHRLHLVGTVVKEELQDDINLPANGSFLTMLWPAVESHFKNPLEFTLKNEQLDPNENYLRRLSSDWQNMISAPNVPFGTNSKEKFSWQLRFDRQIGTVIHQHLQWLSEINVENWEDDTDRNYVIWKKRLHQLGVPGSHMKNCLDAIKTIIDKVYGDARAKWILDNQHLSARSEYSIAISNENEVEQFSIDRTFIDSDGTRWIIDYKTTDIASKDEAAFYLEAKQCYAAQLENYAQYFKLIEQRPIKLALYFPAFGGWYEWASE